MSLPPSSSYATAQTEWPSAVFVKPEIRRLLAHFYYLLDIPDPSIGHRFADEVFTPDGVMFGMGPGFHGEAEIRKSRENAWSDYVSRRHEILRVYTHDADGLDLLVIGRVDMGLRANSSSSSSSNGKAGKIVREEFIARFVVVDDGSLENGEGPRLKYSRVWSNMEPIMAALREE